MSNEYQEYSRSELEEMLELSDRRIADLERLLHAIPECPLHGPCIPHALEWIEAAKQQLRPAGETIVV